LTWIRAGSQPHLSVPGATVDFPGRKAPPMPTIPTPPVPMFCAHADTNGDADRCPCSKATPDYKGSEIAD
jgi:hypothetical protein